MPMNFAPVWFYKHKTAPRPGPGVPTPLPRTFVQKEEDITRRL